MQHAGNREVGADRQLPDIGRRGCERGDGGRGEHAEDDSDEDASQQHRLLDAAIVQHAQGHDRGDGDLVGSARPRVGADGQGHGRAGGGLADHESPTGQVAPEFAEAFAAVDVGAAGGGVSGSQARRGGGVAVGDHSGDRQADRQPGPGSGRCRGERGENARPDHGPEPDDHRVTDTEPTRQPGTGQGHGRRLLTRSRAVTSVRLGDLGIDIAVRQRIHSPSMWPGHAVDRMRPPAANGRMTRSCTAWTTNSGAAGRPRRNQTASGTTPQTEPGRGRQGQRPERLCGANPFQHTVTRFARRTDPAVRPLVAGYRNSDAGCGHSGQRVMRNRAAHVVARAPEPTPASAPHHRGPSVVALRHNGSRPRVLRPDRNGPRPGRCRCAR